MGWFTRKAAEEPANLELEAGRLVDELGVGGAAALQQVGVRGLRAKAARIREFAGRSPAHRRALYPYNRQLEDQYYQAGEDDLTDFFLLLWYCMVADVFEEPNTDMVAHFGEEHWASTSAACLFAEASEAGLVAADGSVVAMDSGGPGAAATDHAAVASVMDRPGTEPDPDADTRHAGPQSAPAYEPPPDSGSSDDSSGDGSDGGGCGSD